MIDTFSIGMLRRMDEFLRPVSRQGSEIVHFQGFPDGWNGKEYRVLPRQRPAVWKTMSTYSDAVHP